MKISKFYRESAQEKARRGYLLQQLQCPFQWISSKETSKYHCLVKSSSSGCPFGHQNELQQKQFVAIPKGVCLRFLMGECLREAGGSKCKKGWHLQLDDLIQDLQLTEFEREDDESEGNSFCDQCHSKPFDYLLECCPHSICDNCLEQSASLVEGTRWEHLLRILQLAPYSIRCQVSPCQGVLSHRVLVWPEKLCSHDQKIAIFKLCEQFNAANTTYGFPSCSVPFRAIGLYYLFVVLEYMFSLLTNLWANKNV